MATRALRVGVLLRDNLVEERVFKGSEPITIGQSLRCRLSVPADGMPHEHQLFVADQGRWLLKLGKGMTGRIAQGGTIKTELPAEGAIAASPGSAGARSNAEPCVVAIERGARGKLQIGEATVLFQEVAAPPVAPRPQLPASVRGTFADRIDRRLAVIIGASLLAHIAIASWAWIQDRESDDLRPYEARVYHDEKVIETTGPDVPETPGPGTASPVAPVQTPAPIVKPTQITTRPGKPTMTDANVDPNAYAQILTGNTGGPNGSEEMRSRQPGADLDKQIRDVNSSGRNPQTARVTRDGEARNGTGHAPGFEITQIDRTDKVERDPYVYIPYVPEPPKKKPGTPTVATVLAKIQGAYMGALKRCYTKGLELDGSLRGKITVTFSVDERGHVIDEGAHGLADGVDTCVSKLMPAWIFPPARDENGDPTEKPFKLGLVFQPGN